MLSDLKPNSALFIPRLIPKDSFIDWEAYSSWYKDSHNKSNSTAGQRIKYARKYCSVLIKSDRNKLAEIKTMSKDKRRLVMASLSNLAKYMGIYEKWQRIRKNNGLRWEKRSALETFLSILNHNVNDTTKWLKDVVKVLPKKYATAVIFTALTGLRASESCLSCKLIVEDLENYLDKELMMLQHFKYPKFLRGSKNAFISFISKELLQLVLDNKPTFKYTALTSAIRKKGYSIKVKELRKLYATTLRNNKIPTEVIDIIEGRVPQSIFLRFYYKPFLKEIQTKTLEAIQPLHEELFSILE